MVKSLWIDCSRFSSPVVQVWRLAPTWWWRAAWGQSVMWWRPFMKAREVRTGTPWSFWFSVLDSLQTSSRNLHRPWLVLIRLIIKQLILFPLQTWTESMLRVCAWWRRTNTVANRFSLMYLCMETTVFLSWVKASSWWLLSKVNCRFCDGTRPAAATLSVGTGC